MRARACEEWAECGALQAMLAEGTAVGIAIPCENSGSAQKIFWP